MKTLKFKQHLVDDILGGKKTTTWRLFDDKDLQAGDEFQCINKDTLEPFGTGIITHMNTRTLGTLTDADWEGHERFPSEEAMYTTYRKYYGDKVGPDTEVKILYFDFKAYGN